ncbi:MAG TPA: F0F1 ATP synthase subunit beta, partial [Streptosporangiaceae bacterium]
MAKTATKKTDESDGADKVAATGRVSRVTGPVVDVEFSAEQMPEINNALQVDVTMGGETKMLTLEVALHIGDNMVRAIS